MRDLILLDLAATRSLAASLGRWADAGTVLLLQGDLGSGKTTFVQELGKGLGIEAEITSPTFVLLQEYAEGRIPLYHCDLYRLAPDEVAELGLEELCQGILAIEWPERLPTLPPGWLRLQLSVLDDEARKLSVSWRGEQHERLWQQVDPSGSERPKRD